LTGLDGNRAQGVGLTFKVVIGKGLNPNVKSKYGAFFEFARSNDVTAHELNELPADGKPQPCALLFLPAGFRLGKWFEQEFVFFRRYAWTGVLYFKKECQRIPLTC